MWQLIAVSFLWAFSFGLIKRYLPGIDSAFIAAARLGLALLVFLPFLRFRGLTPRLGFTLAAIGAVQFGVMYLAYIEAFRYLQAYEAALFTITTPILVTLLADLWEGQLRTRALLAALIAVAGAAFVVVKSSELKLTLAGLILVQVSNAAFATGQIAYKRLRTAYPQMNDKQVFGLLYAGAFAVALAAFLRRDVTLDLHAPQLWTLAYLGIVASGLGFFLWNVGATRASAGTLAVMNNAKVPLGVAVSLLVFGEQADLPALTASLALMIFAVWLAERPEKSATSR